MIKYLRLSQKQKVLWTVVLGLLTWYYFSLPTPLFNDPNATVIYDSEEVLLGAKIAPDGQWRFPPIETVPEKFRICLTQFEDTYFAWHPGFNIVSIAQALFHNFTEETQRGGSTITQQVIRMSRKGEKRTYYEKFIELILATRLEFRFSKQEILALYASHAPFGGNIVGLQAASQFYFKRSPQHLTWAEHATLAVLPNSPALIHLGRNQQLLLVKRNRLLKKLWKNGFIDSNVYQLALHEELPPKPSPLPTDAPHLLTYLTKQTPQQRHTTTLNYKLQTQANHIVKSNYELLSQNGINNIALLVIELETRKVLAYVGNSPTTKNHHKDVNIIHKPRSTGSILKPFLYASMLDAGELLPRTLIPDIPTQIGLYTPQNFTQNYVGMIHADEALWRSLNIPSVKMLQQYGVQKFHHQLQQMQFTHISHPAHHYGLSLILGGAEASLWDICKNYAAMASTINHYNATDGQYYEHEFTSPLLLKKDSLSLGALSYHPKFFSAASAYLTYKALEKVKRPSIEGQWRTFSSNQTISWKTGTSFGFRDAWAVGLTSKYLVGVWVGNADGEGRPGLIGTATAGTILFRMFEHLPVSQPFSAPLDDMKQITTCSESGHIASQLCTTIDTIYTTYTEVQTAPCPYHRKVHLDFTESYQVNASCESLSQIKHKNWFVLPPIAAYYYQKQDPTYSPLPPFREDCRGSSTLPLGLVYPPVGGRITLAKDFDGKVGTVVCSAVHADPSKEIYWYLDEKFVGTTIEIHSVSLYMKPGVHYITLWDNDGHKLRRKVTVLE